MKQGGDEAKNQDEDGGPLNSETNGAENILLIEKWFEQRLG